MKIDKKAINYYYSFFEVSKDLSQKQFYDFNMAIMSVMFFETHIDKVVFEDKMLTILWKSVKHSVQASVKGYCDKKSIPYDEVFAPLSEGVDKPLDNKQEGQEKGQEKVQVKGELIKKEFTFTLDKQKLLSSTSKEYQSNLKDYILSANKQMSYEDFYNQCEMKPYKYKNFKMAYDTWNKNAIAKQQPMQSFKQQDQQQRDNKIDFALENNIFDMIDEMEHIPNEQQGVINAR